MNTNTKPVLSLLLAAMGLYFLPSLSAQQRTAPPDAPSTTQDGAHPSEVERRLLERIEKLEARITELEARTAPGVSTSSTADEGESPLPPGPAVTSPALPTVAANDRGASFVAKHDAIATPGRAGDDPPSRSAFQASPQQAESSLAQSQTSTPKSEPFAFADFTWLNGNPRTKESPMDTKWFTPEVRVDTDYIYDYNHPKDDTIGGSSEVFRANEVQVTQLGVGGDFHYQNVRGRLMTQFGMYSQTTPRNDASPARGQWDLDTAYRYVSEAYGGYHFDVMHGINVDAGIFMSYIGLFSYYNFDNWAYQPSYVSSNTPWFFNGVRVQIFPTDKLKVEPWFVNGWQSYGRFNSRPGIGLQVLWRPNGSVSILGNQYALGEDALGVPGRVRYHTDDSIEVKYYDNPQRFLDKMAFSLTGDIGCEHGGGVSCDSNSKNGPQQSFLGFMFYNRFWFRRDLYGLTLGGGKINNPGRYLVLLPPINGATAISGTPYFTENPGDPFKAWDASATFDYMPKQFVTFRFEFDHRAANVPYFSGPGGITPPGGNTGPAGSMVPGFTPDLRKMENRLDMAILVKM